MDKKSKVGSAKKRPAKAAIQKKTKETQKERFIRAARSIGVDETGKEFDAALKRIVPPKRG
jgi:hypothetical protein